MKCIKYDEDFQRDLIVLSAEPDPETRLRIRLRHLDVILDENVLKNGKHSDAVLTEQLRWHKKCDTDKKSKKIPIWDAIKRVDQKREALIQAVRRYNSSRKLQKRVLDAFAQFDADMEVDQDEEGNGDGELFEDGGDEDEA